MTERGYGEFVRYLGGEITGLGNSLNGVSGIQRRNNAQVPRLISWVEGATGIRKEKNLDWPSYIYLITNTFNVNKTYHLYTHTSPNFLNDTTCDKNNF